MKSEAVEIKWGKETKYVEKFETFIDPSGEFVNMPKYTHLSAPS